MNYQKFKTLTKIEQAVIIESQVKRKYFKSKKLYGLGPYLTTTTQITTAPIDFNY